MAAFFVTGSGTDIGKTWICAGLLRSWRARGLGPGVLKPVVTGFDGAAPEGSDPALLLEALGRGADAAAIAAIAPFRFAAPLSPDQAAAREGRRLSAQAILQACRPILEDTRGPLLIEGAGGAMTPLNDGETMLDLAQAFGAPVLFVAGSYLGALSHALTGLRALSAHGLAVRAVLVNESAEGSIGLGETVASLAGRAAGAPVIAVARRASSGLLDSIAAELIA